jgi:hypothetical protein
MNRRDILRAAAALPAIFGLGGCSRSPSWFGEALRKIRSEGKPGLVLRLPTDPESRCGFGHRLARLVTREDVTGLEVSLQSVLLCLEEDDVRRQLDGARDGEDLLLIDGEGRVLDGLALDPQADLAEQAGKLLDGRALSRLKEKAAAAAKSAPAEALAALDDPASLPKWAHTLLPLLILKHRENVNAGVEAAIESLAPASPPLPYGASMRTGAPSKCGEDPACYRAICGACGLSVVTSRSREFVKFLAK